MLAARHPASLQAHRQGPHRAVPQRIDITTELLPRRVEVQHSRARASPFDIAQDTSLSSDSML
jgi:hypothetical protein